MININNETIKKQIKKVNYYLIASLIFLVITLFAFTFLGIKTIKSKDKTYLNDIIEYQKNSPNITSYLKVTAIPKSFAKYKDEDYAFYIVNDGDYYYIAYLNDNTYKKLNNEKINEQPKTISGVSETTPEEVKELAVETYNEEINPDDTITIDEFESFFGNVFLDTSKNKEMPNIALLIIGTLSGLLTITFLTIFITKKIKIKHLFKNFPLEEIEDLEQNPEDALVYNYDKARITLYNNYLISFTKDIDIVKYNDIIWLYEYELKRNTISINIMLITGKTLTIAEIGKAYKNKDEILNEIIAKITAKNDDILVGFTKENNKQAKRTVLKH